MPDFSILHISELIRDVEVGTLVLRPAFQRRLVWTNVVKDHFLETVMLGLPFPEIFIATGEVDTKTMRRKNLLVDGQQRISTLHQYVQGSTDLILTKVKPYNELDDPTKMHFLDYKVAVRDLGKVSTEEIKEIFARINSTDFALKGIERLNAQFSGAYKQFCDDLSRHEFFDRHGTFSFADLRRMRDLDFCVILTSTLLSTYYHRDSHNVEFLRRFNDSFGKGDELRNQLDVVFAFIDKCDFDKKCRVWKKTDLFTLIVELHSFHLRKVDLNPAMVKDKLQRFYLQVDDMFKQRATLDEGETQLGADQVFRYLKAATKATNDKYARVDRAQVISGLIGATLDAKESRKQPARKQKKQL